MAQYDAYPNPTLAQREAFPYFVVLQSDQLAQFSTRLVMPLARSALPPDALPRRLSQSVQVRGERLFLAPQLCAALPERLLRKPVASLRDSAMAFVDALDAVVSGV
ncbi:MAG: CcdB family protein [Rubrivivax sp.]|nr:CcdB family protein [Rubrivivax sp.]